MIIELLATAGTVITALGGFELVKWIANRRSHSRVENAKAENEELKNEVDEFHFLRERLEFKDQQLLEKEKRFSEQTDHIRSLQKQLLDTTIDMGKVQAENSRLKAEREMKLCEVRNCSNRVPQSGY